MKEIETSKGRNADGVYLVKQAVEYPSKDRDLLYMIVSDGTTTRIANQYYPLLKPDDIRDRFVKIDGVIDEDEILMVDWLDDANISRINIPEFYRNCPIPIDMIFQYFLSESEGFRKELNCLCSIFVNDFYYYCSVDSVAPILDTELEHRHNCALNAFETVWDWKKFIEENRIADKDMILAAVIISSMSSFYEHLFPSGLEYRAKQLVLNEVDFHANEHDVDKDTISLIKKLMLLIYNRSDELREELLSKKFFSGDEL